MVNRLPLGQDTRWVAVQSPWHGAIGSFVVPIVVVSRNDEIAFIRELLGTQ